MVEWSEPARKVAFMEFAEVVKGRRSIRSYQDRSVSDSDIEQMIDLARHAPSSMNGQPWHFVIVKDPQTKNTLAEIKNRYCPKEKQAYSADFLKEAAVIIVVCVDKAKAFDREVENALLASSYIMLSAHNEGIGSVYMSAYAADEPKIAEEIRKELNIPIGIAPISILPMGYPNQSAPPKELRRLQEMIHFERF
jgi:nitroreductase